MVLFNRRCKVGLSLGLERLYANQTAQALIKPKSPQSIPPPQQLGCSPYVHAKNQCRWYYFVECTKLACVVSEATSQRATHAFIQTRHPISLPPPHLAGCYPQLHGQPWSSHSFTGNTKGGTSTHSLLASFTNPNQYSSIQYPYPTKAPTIILSYSKNPSMLLH
jgi:hypothetical protein